MTKKSKQRPSRQRPRGERPMERPARPLAAASVPMLRSGPVESREVSRFVVAAESADLMLDRHLRDHLGDASWNQVRDWIRQGKAAVNGEKVMDPTFLVPVGAEVEFLPKGSRGRPVAKETDFSIVHQDSQVVVVNKPSGLSTVPFEGSERDSLDRLLAARLGQKGRPARLYVVHRLDKATSGLLVFARTDAALKHLKSQFRFHTSHRRYEAVVHGRAASVTYDSRLIADRGDGRRGSTDNPLLGRQAITHVRLLEVLRGASLVECRLETGRTHQIRIHLSEAGHPLLGEPVYAKGYSGTLLPAPRLMLHAKELGFVHPTSGETLHFASAPPSDFVACLEGLRLRLG